MNYAFRSLPLFSVFTCCWGTRVTCVRTMGHGTPDNMNWAGLLQVSESKATQGLSILGVSTVINVCVSD